MRALLGLAEQAALASLGVILRTPVLRSRPGHFLGDAADERQEKGRPGLGEVCWNVAGMVSGC